MNEKIRVELFGSSSIVAKATYADLKNSSIVDNINVYGRNCKGDRRIDLMRPDSYINNNESEQKVWVSFAPIWIFANFISKYVDKNTTINIQRIICCSSTSAETKHYSFNNIDKSLSKRLRESEDELLQVCKRRNIDLVIIRPTLIYGKIDNDKDKNISFIAGLMKCIRILILPMESGERQPIHVRQLASVIKKYIQEVDQCENKKVSRIINVGGDEILTYNEMINRIAKKMGIRIKIIYIPNKVFYFFAGILQLYNQKLYESILRMNADLSRFTKASMITNNDEKKFMESY